jgi:hypothetical protein
VGGNDQALEFLGTGTNRINASNAVATLALRVNGADRLTVLSTGNVGIGTTTPETALTVRGSNTVLTTDPNVLAARFGTGSGGSNAGVGVGSYTGGYGAVQGLAFNSSVGAYLYLNPAGGNVGIGSASGLGSAASALSVSGGTAVGSGYWATAAPTNGLVVQGSVGVGTSSPSAKLHVVGGDIGFPYGSAIRVSPENTALWSSGTTKLVETGWNGSTDFAAYYTPGSIRSAAVLTMLASGNVGIGTTTPSSLLSVQGNAYFGGNITATGTLNVTGQSTFTTASSTGLTATNLYSTTGIITTLTSTNSTLTNASTTNLTISNNAYFGGNTGIWNGSGNVGIGTMTPGSKLTVTGGNIQINGSAAPSVLLTPTSGSSYVVGANTAISGAGIYDSTGGAWRLMVQDTTGNIGLGTTSPVSPLVVYGAGNYGQADIVSSAANGEAGLLFKSADDTDGSGWLIGKNLNLTDDSFGIFRGGNLFTINTNGNVGIGTTTPSAKLTVSPYQSSIGTLTNGATSLIVGNSTALGTTVGSYLYPQELQSSTGNVVRLQTSLYRRVAGSGGKDTG